jgi:thioredoxin reductase
MIGIMGGGVAGMACALWLKRLGYTPIIIEQHVQLGGQLLNLHRVNHWVLGMPDLTSAELAKVYAQHIQKEAITIFYQTRLLAVTTTATGFSAIVGQDDKKHVLSLRAIVIATGARALGLEVFASLPGFQQVLEAELVSSFPFDHLDKLDALTGKRVAVIGGGDNAHFTAKDMALAGSHVHLLQRSLPKARATIRGEVMQLINQGRITEQTQTQVRAFRLYQQGITITLDNGANISVDRIFARLGFVANSECLLAFPAFNGIVKEAGYIQTDSCQRTSLPWVYAIGDVANARHQSVVNAIASGAIAAQDLSERVQMNERKF